MKPTHKVVTISYIKYCYFYLNSFRLNENEIGKKTSLIKECLLTTIEESIEDWPGA